MPPAPAIQHTPVWGGASCPCHPTYAGAGWCLQPLPSNIHRCGGASCPCHPTYTGAGWCLQPLPSNIHRCGVVPPAPAIQHTPVRGGAFSPVASGTRRQLQGTGGCVATHLTAEVRASTSDTSTPHQSSTPIHQYATSKHYTSTHKCTRSTLLH